MRKNLHTAILVFLLVTSEIVFGKEANKTKFHKSNNKHNNNNNFKEKLNTERIKRSLDDEENKPFSANREKKNIEYINLNNKYDYDLEHFTKSLKNSDHIMEKTPYSLIPTRHESSSAENIDESVDYDNSNCKNCYGTIHFDSDRNFKNRRDHSLTPFWGNRGRRSSDEIEDNEPFWGNRGRRQDDEPFWGTRGRRQDTPFWGARGRREDEPFLGNRGRRDETEPFWGNRGRRQDSEPFWGTRGRRQGTEPFWGSRGRREDVEPFWGNRGRRKESEPFWGNRGRRKEDLKESILEAINLVENDIEHLSRLRRSDQSFWSNRGRESKLKYLFNLYPRSRIFPHQIVRAMNMDLKSTEPGTLQDGRIFADEPQFIVVERNSRSSAEAEDPFYISRGKKYYLNYNLIKAARDRRGAIEEIVKSVRNDPYYIARGKKDAKMNSTTEDEFLKVKELICSAINLIAVQPQNGKAKREIDSDRDRRSILKKLAARLQIDPFPISRGKKNDGNEINLHEFVTNVAEKCN